jgi:hypothetical protein
LTNLVAGSPHPIQNLEFFSVLDVKGSILFNVFSNNYIFSNYVERRYIINHTEQSSVSAPKLLRFKENGIQTHWVKSSNFKKCQNFLSEYETNRKSLHSMIYQYVTNNGKD